MAVLWSLPYEDKTIDVKCYDRYSNEILGLECKTEITGVDFNTKLLISAFVETMLVVVLVIQIKHNIKMILDKIFWADGEIVG